MNLQIRLDLQTRPEPLILEWEGKTLAWLHQKAHDIAERFWAYYRRTKQRQVLRELNDHQLKDIGISRVDALQEANKPFWIE